MERVTHNGKREVKISRDWEREGREASREGTCFREGDWVGDGRDGGKEGVKRERK